MPRPKTSLAQVLMAALCALSLLGAACQAQQPAPATSSDGSPKQGGTLRLAHRGDPTLGWDPMVLSGILLLHVAQNVDGAGNMVRRCRNDTYKICPNLAESWESNGDFTQWTFKIRDNVLWHDGTPFTAEDAKFWIDLSFNGAKNGDKVRPPSANKLSFGDLKQAEVLSGNRLRLTLGRPIPTYLEGLAEPQLVIAHPRHLMQPQIDQGNVTVSPQDIGFVGLGGFKMTKWDKGSQVQLTRFDKYWEKDAEGRQLPYLNGIDFFITRDPAAMIAAFRSEQLDGGASGTPYGLLPAQRTQIQQAMGDKVWFAEIAGYRWHMWFNVLRAGPWQDVKVRRAMLLWVDKRAGMQAVLGGQSFLTTMMDPRSPWPNPDWQTWPGYNKDTREKDRAEARRLLAEAGYADGFKIDFLCRDIWVSFCEWIQGDLAPLKVQVQYKVLDEPTQQVQGRTITNWDIQQIIANNQSPEGLQLRLARFSANANAAPKHEDPKVPEFFDRLNNAQTLDQRVQIYRELERYILVEQVYGVSWFDEILVIPYRSYVKGMAIPLENNSNANDRVTVWMDK